MFGCSYIDSPCFKVIDLLATDVATVGTYTFIDMMRNE